MWSGLLPPGLNESDVDLSSDDGDESLDSCSKQDAKEDTERVHGTGQESNASSEPLVLVTDEEEICGASEETPGNENASERGKQMPKKKAPPKSSQQLENEDKWKELTQYFGINDRFESPVDSRAPQKSGLELSIEKCVAEGDIAKAEELSDRLAIRELGVKIAKAAACRNFVKAKQEAEAAQEAQKKKKLAWGFEAKKRWETKSNMGYM
ncbi:protein FAM204A isoform X3 [Haemorhous mexicanus]|uniref:protein FAM204A isoform X3 n=1 Tax=Haemorhous mexicanus TaxID=30427 RepID=UPI0028BEBB2B|nr:protein FAM204A isoform X3 [Haemorhous mexicanus]